MVRGTKKKENSKTRVLSIRITEEQYNLIQKNKWIKEDVIEQVRNYLDAYKPNDK